MVDLVHKDIGYYAPASGINMPDKSFIKATYVVYTDAGHTTESTVYQYDLDVFYKIDPDQYKATDFSAAGEYTATLSGIQADLDNPDQYKADVSIYALDIMKLVKQNRQWNMSTENILATSIISARNVAIGKTDYILIKIKEDADSDWTTPIREEKIYAWYKTMGDDSPYYMGEAS
jgi:hypothetical protein